jgi:hypothetical protein
MNKSFCWGCSWPEVIYFIFNVSYTSTWLLKLACSTTLGVKIIVVLPGQGSA